MTIIAYTQNVINPPSLGLILIVIRCVAASINSTAEQIPAERGERIKGAWGPQAPRSLDLSIYDITAHPLIAGDSLG